MSRELRTYASPALPDAGPAYSQGFFAQHNNVLRLFFNRLTATINALLGQDGGSLLELPSGAFYDTTTQTAAVINTAYAVTFNTASERRVIVASSSQVTVGVSGMYRAAGSAQFKKTTAGGATAWLWLRKNGADIAGTAMEVEVTGGAVIDGAAFSHLLSLVEDDYIQLIWSASSTAVALQAVAAAAPVPALPSAVLNITYASMVRP